MKAAVLFSGGKDSALASILLEPFFEVELVTLDYGHHNTTKTAEKTAEILGFPHRTVLFEREILEEALQMLLSTGYPRDALNYVHRCAVETLAQENEFVADGTKREDRVPMIGQNEVRSLEDRLGAHYIRPLAGYGSKTINLLASNYMEFEMLPSEDYPASDFEVGLRQALEERCGPETVAEIFPTNHMHSRVIRRKGFEHKNQR